MEEQKLMQLIAEMIQAKVTPQEMIGKLTQMGLSEEQAISAVKMVASKLNGGQEQPEKMENGSVIRPSNGYTNLPSNGDTIRPSNSDTMKSVNNPIKQLENRANLLDTAERVGYDDVYKNRTVEDDALDALRRVPRQFQKMQVESADTLRGAPRQLQKMEDGSAIQPSDSYIFNKQSAKIGGNEGLYNDAVRSGYYGATKDAQGNWTVQGANSTLPVQIRGNQAYVNNRPQPWLTKVISNSNKPNLNMQAPAPQLLAGSSQPAKPLMENGGKMQNGDAIQPTQGYVFNEQSAKVGGNYGLYKSAERSGYYDAIQDAQGNWTAEGQNKERVPITIGRDGKPYIGNRTYDWLSTVVANSKKPNLNIQAPAPAPQLLAGSGQPTRPLMENGGNLQFYKKGGKMAPAKPGKKEKKCSCGCKLVLKKVGGKITEQCGCGCKVKK